MTVKELKQSLIGLDDDMKVFVTADHGQQATRVSSVDLYSCWDVEAHDIELILPDEEENYVANTLTKICLISD